MAKTKTIGLYFGTFNPIHMGHLIIANYLVEFSAIDELWFVITPHNPHKKKKSLLEDYHRMEMVEKAIVDYPKFKASNIEFNLPQPNFTVNTLVHLEEKYPKYAFSLIMGEDNLKSLHRWKNFEIILKNYKLLVYPRISEGAISEEIMVVNEEGKRVLPENIEAIPAPIIELSSTFIREAIANKKDVRAMVPKPVWDYIDLMNFYKK